MFKHSVKVPRHYKVASNILKKVSIEGGSVKSLLYDDKLRHYRTDVLFALITETIKHAADINNIFEYCEIFKKEPRLDPWLAKILTAELLYGKKTLPGKSKPEETILSYKEAFENYVSEHQDDMKPEVASKPRYVRVNTNLLTTSDAIRTFQDEQYKFIRCTSGPYKDYLEQIQNLRKYEFTQDYHVKTIFVFPSGTKLHDHKLYQENKIILQNKSTAMAVHLLAPQPGSVIMDMCAAPGMKTTQLAAYMRNNCKIYAIERSEQRYQTLCEFVAKTGSTSVKTIHKDCLEIKRGDYDDVQYIILDPSCSGSGMDISVHSYIDEGRLSKLTSLQEKFLKHAMNAFPNAKRIVYSTCSLFPEENERVITNVVRTSRAKWRVQDTKVLLKDQWNNFGSAMYGSIGTRCLYARPESDFTTGFFLAVLDRDFKQMEKNANNENGIIAPDKIKNKKDKEKTTEANDKSSIQIDKVDSNLDMDINENERKDTAKVSKSKENKHKRNHNIVDSNDNSVENTDNIKEPKRKKKKHNDVNILVDSLTELEINRTEDDTGFSKKKKRKKDKHETSENNLDPVMANIVIEGEEKTKKKKKRKKENDSRATEHIDTDDTLQKERMADKSVQLERNNIDSNDVDMEPPRKKKKKNKRNKILQDCD